MNKSDFMVMQEMSSKNKDIRMSGTIVETRTVKQGGIISIGVDAKTLQDVSLTEDYYVVLYVLNKKQFNEIKDEKG